MKNKVLLFLCVCSILILIDVQKNKEGEKIRCTRIWLIPIFRLHLTKQTVLLSLQIRYCQEIVSMVSVDHKIVGRLLHIAILLHIGATIVGVFLIKAVL